MRCVTALIAAVLALLPVAAAALEPPPWASYDCPGFENPGACFTDADEDGCFSPPLDVIVEPELVAGDTGMSGGLVCPPGAGPLEVAPFADTFVSWIATGHSAFHGTVIRIAEGVTLRVLVGTTFVGSIPDRRLVLDNVKVRGKTRGGFRGLPTGQAYFDGSVVYDACDDCEEFETSLIILGAGGTPSTLPGGLDLWIGDNARLKAGIIELKAHTSRSPPVTGANIRLGRRVKLQSLFAHPTVSDVLVEVFCLLGTPACAGTIETDALILKPRGQATIVSDSGPITMRGRTRVHGMRSPTSALELHSPATLTVDRLVARVGASVRMSGEAIALGDGGAGSVRLRAGGSVTFDAVGDLMIDRAKVQSTDVTLTTAGPALTFRESRIKGEGVTTSTVDVMAGSGATCDFTRSRFLETTLTENCASVVGP